MMSEIVESEMGENQNKLELVVFPYSVGEVRVGYKTERVFKDGDELEKSLQAVVAELRIALEHYSIKRYGSNLFKVYSDGASIRVQSGLHDITEEDRLIIKNTVTTINESS